jgi:hypothetical protein
MNVYRSSIIGGRDNIIKMVDSYLETGETIGSSAEHPFGDNIILGGYINSIEGATSSYGNCAILGGSRNCLKDDVENSAIIGGYGILGTKANTVYLPDVVITKSEQTPTTSSDSVGEVGSITWDNNYVYVKTELGWGRSSLDYGF